MKRTGNVISTNKAPVPANIGLQIAPKHKVVVIGDSHGRGCSSEINSKLKSKGILTYGVVKPGMCLQHITESAKQDIQNLTKNDAVVVWGGANDIAKRNTDMGQRHLSKFVNANNHTNIVVISAPHRYDLEESSCVNTEVERYNRLLKKRMKPNTHVTVM